MREFLWNKGFQVEGRNFADGHIFFPDLELYSSTGYPQCPVYLDGYKYSLLPLYFTKAKGIHVDKDKSPIMLPKGGSELVHTTTLRVKLYDREGHWTRAFRIKAYFSQKAIAELACDERRDSEIYVGYRDLDAKFTVIRHDIQYLMLQ